jgi:hypothetical protein
MLHFDIILKNDFPKIVIPIEGALKILEDMKPKQFNINSNSILRPLSNFESDSSIV